MDQFTVPKFIEHEAKIVGPFTFKQFVFIGAAGVVCFFLYFTVPFFLFVAASAVIMLLGFGLAFLQSGGRSLPIILKNFFIFSAAPKVYLWKKKEGMPPKIIEKEENPAETDEVSMPKIAGHSRLKNLSSQVEVGIKKD